MKELIPKLNTRHETIESIDRDEQNSSRFFSHTELEQMLAQSPHLTKVEFEWRLNQFYNEIVEAVKTELDRRNEQILELSRKAAREEIQILLSQSSQIEEGFINVLNDLKNSINKSNLPNPEIYFKEIECHKIVNVVIDDSESYLEYLNKFSQIVNDIYLKHDFELEIFLFETSEIRIPFYEQEFKQF
jgi:hypothetical protein